MSYTAIRGEEVGMPIGNLASQIFANIYLNELDRFIVHQLKPKNYPVSISELVSIYKKRD